MRFPHYLLNGLAFVSFMNSAVADAVAGVIVAVPVAIPDSPVSRSTKCRQMPGHIALGGDEVLAVFDERP